jgi:molybdopterin synthase catalytic subunit
VAAEMVELTPTLQMVEILHLVGTALAQLVVVVVVIMTKHQQLAALAVGVMKHH